MNFEVLVLDCVGLPDICLPDFEGEATCLVHAASSTGRCNTMYSVGPTVLPLENRPVGLYSIRN